MGVWVDVRVEVGEGLAVAVGELVRVGVFVGRGVREGVGVRVGVWGGVGIGVGVGCVWQAVRRRQAPIVRTSMRFTVCLSVGEQCQLGGVPRKLYQFDVCFV